MSAKPLSPDDDGVLAYNVPVATVSKLSTILPNSAASRTSTPENHVSAPSAAASSPAKTPAHFFVQPNTIAYGRYWEKMSWSSANRARSALVALVEQAAEPACPRECGGTLRGPGRCQQSTHDQRDAADDHGERDQAEGPALDEVEHGEHEAGDHQTRAECHPQRARVCSGSSGTSLR